jgi:hypothetical protein
VRFELALVFCGNRICEVTTATLGPLPLDQLPKSKPVTPYAVLTDHTQQPDSGNACRSGRYDQRTDVNTRLGAGIPPVSVLGQP